MKIPQRTKSRTKQDSANPPLGIYAKKKKIPIRKDTYTLMLFTAALFKTAKLWKQPKCPLTDEWIMEMCVCVCARARTRTPRPRMGHHRPRPSESSGTQGLSKDSGTFFPHSHKAFFLAQATLTGRTTSTESCLKHSY